MSRNVCRREFDLFHATSCNLYTRLTYLRSSAKPAQSRLTFINNLFILPLVIQTFASSEKEHFFATGKSRRLPPEILKRAALRLTQLDGVAGLEDLRFPPSNRLEALAHDRAGQWSIRIND